MNSQKLVVVLLGPPGSGKGTQAKVICTERHLPHISTGDLFRYHISHSTELGHKAKSYINQGKLVPDALVLNMLYDRISQEDCGYGYLLDGFPRTITQAESLNAHLDSGVKLIVINLDVGDETLIKRISGRLTCQACGNMYNRFFTPPISESICDHCGGTLFQREDDKPEVVKERLNVYSEQTAPLIQFYRSKGILHALNGEDSPAEVLAEINAILSL